jgi:hypothetical protein
LHRRSPELARELFTAVIDGELEVDLGAFAVVRGVRDLDACLPVDLGLAPPFLKVREIRDLLVRCLIYYGER